MLAKIAPLIGQVNGIRNIPHSHPFIEIYGPFFPAIPQFSVEINEGTPRASAVEYHDKFKSRTRRVTKYI